MSELRKIPNVGKTTEKDLIAMGYTTIESLKGKTAEQLYEEECSLRGESPCGAVCIKCGLFPKTCEGCRKIKGKVYWLQYTGGDVCKVYDCCINQKGQTNCGKCDCLPCERFTKDPTISDEQNKANLKKMIERLKKYNG